MRHFAGLFLMLLALHAPTCTHAQELQEPPTKSAAIGVGIALANTIVPIAVGLPILWGENYLIGGPLFAYGLIVGPFPGNVYAGDKRRGLKGMGIRTGASLLGILTVFASEGFEDEGIVNGRLLRGPPFHTQRPPRLLGPSVGQVVVGVGNRLGLGLGHRCAAAALRPFWPWGGGSQHHQRLHDDMRPVPGDPLMFGLAVLDPTLIVEPVALLHPLLHDVGQLPEERQPVPVRILLLRSGLVLPCAVRGQRQLGDLGPAGGRSDLRGLA